ncbi:MAG: VCBS repeat-containing protein [Saprospiraceae bacterium]|nr:VCBS repeat-containing protein [Saprospiraceae bacterium]
MKHHLIGLLALCILSPLQSQIRFTDASDKLFFQEVTSGVAIGVADMNGDSLDDIIRLHDTRRLRIDYQQADSSHFAGVSHNTLFGGQWSLCIGDANNDGFNDIFTGGIYNGLKVLLAKEEGSFYQSRVYTSPSIFLQGSNFVDINNDGALDIFACHDEGLSVVLRNEGDGQYTPDTTLLQAVSTIPSDNSGNYGSVWTDFDNDLDLDLYISKCREGVQDPGDGRRLNLLFRNDGDGQWSEITDSLGLQPRAQSWAADFADIDNDGDFDCFIINHDQPSQLLLNTGDHQYIDITDSINLHPLISESFPGIQCKFVDFDNNGFVDLLITSTGDQHVLLLNEGNLNFTNSSDSLLTPRRIQSAAIGDLNNDGFLDLLAGFANNYNQPTDEPDRLYLNEGNDNHFLKVLLEGSLSNRNAIGARITSYGPWGIQIREVRSGEGYGVMHSFTQHFGLGQYEQIDSVVIDWPSGVIDRISNPGIDQLLVVQEGESCTVGLSFSWEAAEFELSFQSSLPDSQAVYWSFGDGSDTLLAIAPTHTFESIGEYEVCVEVELSCGLTERFCQDLTVACIPPTGFFSVETDELHLNLSPIDEDGILHQWTFGDGSDTAYTAQVTHQYDLPGDYEICLTITDNCQTAISCQTVEVRCTPPTPDFSIVADELEVTFSDASIGGPTDWTWFLGDGNQSSDSAFIHTYDLPGTYEICLRVSNICGGEDQMKCQSITLSCSPPTANFGYIVEELTLSLVDSSDLATTDWFWTFGDGDTSTVANPSHSFDLAGQYEVCLSSANVCGSSQHCQLINVGCAPPIARFIAIGEELQQAFQDSSLHAPSSWYWTFGDGNSSVLQAPIYTYAESGTYEVCLRVENLCGIDQQCQNLTIINTATQQPTTGQTYRIFPNPSNGISTLSWRFGSPPPEQVDIVTLQGKRIQQIDLHSSSLNSIPIEIEETGLYLVRVQAKGQAVWLKYVKK